MAKKKNVQRKDGRYAVQIYLGMIDGKRKYKTVYGFTQKEADLKAQEVKLALRKGLDIASERDTFEDWADRWFQVKIPEISYSQQTLYKSSINHLNRYIKDAPVSKLTSADIQKVISELSIQNPNTGKPASRQLLKSITSTAGQIFAYIIDNRVLDYNPVVAVKLPKTEQEQKNRALTQEEQRWIIETAHRAQRAAMIMMYAGLRRGELIPLMWKDIDLGKRTITVSRTIEFRGNQPKIKNTAKTKNSIRTIDIPTILADFLKVQPHESIYVCTNAQNQIHTQSSWKRMWDSYLLTLNQNYGDFTFCKSEYKSKYDSSGTPFVIPHITPHWLRHTFATLLYLSGVNVRDAMEQLGHSDIKTTLSIYTHLDQNHKRHSMNKLDDFLNASQMQVKTEN